MCRKRVDTAGEFVSYPVFPTFFDAIGRDFLAKRLEFPHRYAHGWGSEMMFLPRAEANGVERRGEEF
jgi:hypothetical protein